MDDPGAPESGDAELGCRLARLDGRLRLLLAHLAGPAVRRRVEVDDLLQEVYLRALAAPQTLPGPSEGEAELYRYLTHVARHTVIDVVRAARAARRGGRDRLLPAEWSRTGLGRAHPEDPGPGPATRVQADESAQRLARALAALSAEHRRVLGLRKFEGLSAREAGRRMGRSERAVHSLYRRALEAWEAELSWAPPD